MEEEENTQLPDAGGIIPKDFKVLAKTATGFLKEIINPAAHEVGNLLADEVKFFRFKRQVTILNKAKKYLEEKGVQPGKVDLKTIFPILNEGSLEEDESMNDKWAALLANAVDPEHKVTVQPSFPHILKELTPKEAFVLDRLANMVEEIRIPKEEWISRGGKKEAIMLVSGLSEEEFEIFTDNLIRLNLCSTPSAGFDFLDNNYKYKISDKDVICLTHFGYAFVRHVGSQNEK